VCVREEEWGERGVCVRRSELWEGGGVCAKIPQHPQLDIPACTSCTVVLVSVSNPLLPTQKKSSSPVTLTERTLLMVKSSSCWDTMVISSPLSISILFSSLNQVIFGNGMDLTRHVKFAMSPRISGPVDWGSSVMLTKAAEDVRAYS